MTMHINLSVEMEGFVRDKVAGGMYGNATEVIRDAVRRMQAEEARVAAWQAAIKVGDDSSGPTSSSTAPCRTRPVPRASASSGSCISA